MFVSGAIGSSSGKVVFGGDVIISGSITAIGGGAAGTNFFSSTTTNAMFATGSLALRGGEGSVDAASDKGADIFFYVSGTAGGPAALSSKSMFGGDVVMSGGLDIKGAATIGGGYGSTGVTITGTGGISANGNLILDGNATIGGDLTVNGTTTTVNTTNLLVKDPVILIGSGSVGTNSNGGIALASGSSVTAQSLVWGRVANDTWGAGRKDISDGLVTNLNDMTLVGVRTGKLEIGGSTAYLTGVNDGSTIGVMGSDLVLSNNKIFLTGSIESGLNSRANGNNSRAAGLLTTATADYSHAEGWNTYTLGLYSHTEGEGNTAEGIASHAEGRSTLAYGAYSHSEGSNTTASGSYSHSEGYQTLTLGSYSHAEGRTSSASGDYSHAEGYASSAPGDGAHAEGRTTIASGVGAHSEGRGTIAAAIYSHAAGYETIASGSYSYVGGRGTISSGSYQHIVGKYNVRGNSTSLFIVGDGSDDTNGGRHDVLRVNSGSVEVTGSFISPKISGSHTTLADGRSYLVAGSNVTIVSASDGQITISSTGGGGDSYFSSTTAGSIFTTGSVAIRGGESSVDSPSDKGADVFFYVSGTLNNNTANAKKSLFGGDLVISGTLSQGELNVTSGKFSHAEGSSNTASGDYSHAEGNNSLSSGTGAHAEGYGTIASGTYSHAEGLGTIASGSGQLVIGKYNKRGDDSSLFVIGNGTGDANVSRSDVFRVLSGSLNNGRVEVTGTFVSSKISGSLTNLADGRSYLVAGANVTIVSASDGQITISSSGGGGGGDSYFSSTTAGSIFTTGSVAIRGNDTSVDSPSDKGADVFFYVSGSITGSGGFGAYGVSQYRSLFGGDVVISGSIVQGDAKATEQQAVAFGSSIANGTKSAAFNSGIANGPNSFAINGGQADGSYSHAEGLNTLATGDYSHAEGRTTTAEGNYSHAEGRSTKSYGLYSHAEGDGTVTSGSYSHSEGQRSIAWGSYSHAGGIYTIASGSGQTVYGKYNLRGNTSSLFVIGNGTGDDNVNRSDVVRAETSGLQVTGSLYVTNGISGSHTTLADGRSFLVAGSNITIVSASDGQITISSTGGGGGGDTYFSSVTAGEVFTTGSIVSSGSLSVKDGSGNSVFSASTGGLVSARRFQLSGSSGITGSLVIQDDLATVALLTLSSSAGSATLNETSAGDFEIRNTKFGGNMTFGLRTSTGNAVNFMTVRPNGAAVSTLVSILPSIYAGPANPVNSTDTNFFVGGTVGSRGGSNRGAGVFGGDLVISGSAHILTGISVTGSIAITGNIMPDADRTQDLGSPSMRWANVYTGDLHLRNDRGDYTLIEEEDFLSIRFNKTGKRYRFLLEPVPDLDEDPKTLL
jgi:hypothetical protein